MPVEVSTTHGLCFDFDTRDATRVERSVVGTGVSQITMVVISNLNKIEGKLKVGNVRDSQHNNLNFRISLEYSGNIRK